MFGSFASSNSTDSHLSSSHVQQSSTATRVKELQAALNVLLEQKVTQPSLPLHAVGKELIGTIVTLISEEGMDLVRARERLLQGKHVY